MSERFEDWECGICSVKAILREKYFYRGHYYHECANCGMLGEIEEED